MSFTTADGTVFEVSGEVLDGVRYGWPAEGPTVYVQTWGQTGYCQSNPLHSIKLQMTEAKQLELFQ